MTFPYRLIDLTHSLHPDMPSWNGSCGFQHDIKLDYDQCTSEVKFRVQQIKMHAGIGTHMDAPAHAIPGASAIDDLDINHFAAPCVVVDVSDRSHELYRVSVADVEAFEAEHGRIPDGAFVIFYTGWDKFWGDSDKYRNNYIFPDISGEVAHLLLKRNVVGLGIDTMSPDRPKDGIFPVHAALLGAGKYIVENVANAKSVPPTGAYSLALPIKTVGGTEAPVRLVALMDDSGSCG